jgi:hypothetical protein
VEKEGDLPGGTLDPDRPEEARHGHPGADIAVVGAGHGIGEDADDRGSVPAKEAPMSKTTRFMVYSAITEAQALRHFEADAVQAEREGYVPVARSWDATTLTVTYERLGGEAPMGPTGGASTIPAGAGLGSRLRRRLGLGLGS